MTPVALTVAGSDPTGGAGLQADLETFHRHDVYGMSVVTLLTVQNTRTVSSVDVLDASLVLKQLDAVRTDIPPQAAKTGALGNAAVIVQRGVKNVLVTGGQLDGAAVDVLWTDGVTRNLAAEQIRTQHTHGAGCVLSAAITARLAGGEDIVTAVTKAKRFITEAIRAGPGLGGGCGPVNMNGPVQS